MKRIIYIYLLLVVVASCGKVLLQDSYSISEYTEKYIEENEELYFIDNTSSSFQFQTLNGCKIIFEENSFWKNGNTFDGEVKFRFLFVPNRIAMIKSGMPSMYKDFNNSVSLMESGGKFLLEAYDNSDGTELLSHNSYTVIIPRSLTGAKSNSMSLFIMQDQDSKFWTRGSENLNSGFSGVTNSDEAFQLNVSAFGWINCDDIIYSNGISYNISINYPLGFDDTNSYVFIALDSFPNSIGNLSLKIPKNEDGKIIFVARDDNNFYLTSDSFVATSDIIFEFANSTLEKISIADFDGHLASILE